MAVTTASVDKTENNVMANAAREALYDGLISFGLFVLLVGLRTDQNIRNELILVQRWGLLAVLVGIVMVGRFVISAFIRPELERRREIGRASCRERVKNTGARG